MPNIELHGFNSTSDCAGVYVAALRLLKGVPFEEQVIFTLEDNTAVDMRGGGQPYVRIFATKAAADAVDEIIKRLEPLNLDVEVAALERFVARDSAKGHWQDYVAAMKEFPD